MAETNIGAKVVSYVEEGADINTKNVNDVIARIKAKMKEEKNKII